MVRKNTLSELDYSKLLLIEMTKVKYVFGLGKFLYI